MRTVLVTGKTIHADDDTATSTPFVDAIHLGQILGVGRRTIESWEREHGLPSYRLSGKVTRYNLAEIDVWLAERRVGGTPRVPLVDGVAPALRVRGLRPGQEVDVVINGIAFHVTKGTDGVAPQEIAVIVDGSVYRARVEEDSEGDGE